MDKRHQWVALLPAHPLLHFRILVDGEEHGRLLHVPFCFIFV